MLARLVLTLLALPVSATPTELPDQSGTAPKIHSWLVLDPLETSAAPFTLGSVYARHLLAPAAPLPRAGDTHVGSDRVERQWRAYEPTEGGLSGPFRAAVGTCSVAETDVWMLAVAGAGQVFVNGRAVFGAASPAHLAGLPVQLVAGENHVFLFDVEPNCRVHFFVARPLALDLAHARLPWITRETESWFLQDAVVPVVNGTMEPLSYVHMHYGAGYPEWSESPQGINWQCGYKIPPLGFLAHDFLFGPDDDLPELVDANEALFDLSTYTEDYSHSATLRIPLQPVDAEFEPGSRWIQRFGRRPPEHKPAHLTGVLEDYFTLVYGTQGTPAEDAENLARASHDEQLLWSRLGRSARLVSDEKFAVASSSVLLYGNSETNRAWDVVFPDDLRATRDQVRLGERSFGGDNLCALVAHRFRSRGREFVAAAIAGTGARGARLAYALNVADIDAQFPNWIVFDERVLTGGLAAALAVGMDELDLGANRAK